jgi:hypothetical protein
MAAVYLFLFCYYYPCTHGIEDEVGFINQAIVWSRGAISAEGAGFDHLDDFVEREGRHVAWRNPGRSLLILPFLALGGVSAVFVSGAVVHLLLTGTVALTLARLGKRPLGAALVLCHPTLAVYSRTIMGDEPAALGLSCALLAFVATSRPGLWVGTGVGAAAVMRYQVGVVLPFFALAILTAPHVVARGRQALYCMLAGGAFGVTLITYNLYLYGNPTGLVGQGSFSPHYVGRNLAFYSVTLLVVWPLMLLGPGFDCSRARPAVLAISAPLLTLTSGWYYHDHNPSWAHTLVIGQRLIIPIIPGLVVTYASWLEKGVFFSLFSRRARVETHLVIVGSCAMLVVLLVALFQSHDAHLSAMRSARDEMARAVPAGSLVIGNSTIKKLFGVPRSELPDYRWRSYVPNAFSRDDRHVVRSGKRACYLILLLPISADELPEGVRDYMTRFRMTRVPTANQTLWVYRIEAVVDWGESANARPDTGASR